jgi:hypothetical protein
MKIVLYGACSFPYFYRPLIQRAKEQAVNVDWHVIITSWRHLPLVDDVLPKEKIFYLHEHLNPMMRKPMPDTEVLHSHPGSIYKDITADRDFPGQLRRQSKEYQLKHATNCYILYKSYLEKERPDAVFFPFIETHDAMVLYSVAREFGIQTVFQTHSRNLIVSFFASTPNEDVPPYALQEPADPKVVEQAKKIVQDFVSKPLAAVAHVFEPKPEEIVPFRVWTQGHRKLGRIPSGLWNILQDKLREPHSARPSPFWVQPRMQMLWLTETIWKIASLMQDHYFELRKLEQLPSRFIYFPLHVFPEISISTMAPYYDDQLRAIDLLRYHMPSDHYLVVKEHPIMKGRRPFQVYRQLRKRAGIILADTTVPSLELVRRASLTVGITGTACFEAMFLGKPSLCFGKTFFSPWCHQFDSFDHLGDLCQKAIHEDPAEIHKRAVDCVTKVLSAGYPFILHDPHVYDIDPKYTMNYPNIDRFTHALIDHLQRLKRSA